VYLFFRLLLKRYAHLWYITYVFVVFLDEYLKLFGILPPPVIIVQILNDMRQGKFLFVILSLVGVNNVFGQNWYPGSTYTNINPSTTNVGIGVAVSPAVAPIAKLQVIGTTTLPAAIFSTGNVGIGSFTTAASVTDLLHVKDGNAFFQNSTLRISKQGGEALLVSAGISRLTGGIYVGSQQVGGGVWNMD
jgi:hypothetical protein